MYYLAQNNLVLFINMWQNLWVLGIENGPLDGMIQFEQ